MRTLWRLAGVVLCALALGAIAADYPAKSIRIVVPFPPGGMPDILVRELGARLTPVLRQQIVIDNRPGAAGNIGTELVARAAPDGYTLLMGTVSTHSINQSLYARLPFKPIEDFAPIILVATMPNVLVVNPAVPAKSVKELIALAKSKPGEITFGSGGNGTSHHLAGELFKTNTGVDMMHVPYKGAGQALPDLLSGQVSIMFDNLISSIPHIRSGKLRALATTAPKRSPILPDTPTLQEAGVPGFDVRAWSGLLAPAKTPPAIVNKLNQEIAKILRMPEVSKKLLEQGAEAQPGTPEEFGAFIKTQTERWAKIVKDSGARID